ncbi:MAG: fasciclin [Bacteroidetes bacterium RIFCSPLOWO2_12_FULL_35_15]|nr:MAG: fasciclin [Bacteroidetes bacterium RIFCSPLOWO2_12_FULL_35_15]
MKKNVFRLLLTGAFSTIIFVACNSEGTKEGDQTATESTTAPAVVGQSGVVDDVSQKNVVGVAVGSPDHTTLVTAVTAAELVDALSNAGPFTVFAPTNAAFEKLPAGTVEGLLVPEKKESLQEILQYHVSVGVYKLENLKDGQQIDEVFGGKVTIGVKDGKYTVNGANILATVPASNGIVYVIDQVIFAPKK